MAQQGPVGRGHNVVGFGHFEKPKFNALIIGDMIFQLINPFVEEESFDKINRLSIQVQPVVYDSSNLHDRF